MLEVGADAVIPANNAVGNLDKALFAVGGEVQPIKFLNISSGVAFGGNNENRVSVPFGIGVNLFDRWEAGVSTPDVVSLISDGSVYGITAGFLRFGI